MPLSNNRDTTLTRGVDVSVNIAAVPLQTGEETVKLATTGTGTVIVWLVVHVAIVIGS